MAAEDVLAKRRYERRVGRIEALMRESLKPEYQGYGDQVVLSVEAVEELSDPSGLLGPSSFTPPRRSPWNLHPDVAADLEADAADQAQLGDA